MANLYSSRHGNNSGTMIVITRNTVEIKIKIYNFNKMVTLVSTDNKINIYPSRH